MVEIAAELGLARETVSAVLNDRAARIGVTEATIRRVREHLERRGFVPSSHALRLRGAPSRVTGILHLGGLYTHLIEAFNQLTRAVSDAAPAVELMVTSPDRVETAIRELLARQVTDLVWLHNGSANEAFRDPRLAGYLARMRTVVYNHLFDSPLGDAELTARGIYLVGVNRLESRARLARYLHRLGHRTVMCPGVSPVVAPRFSAVFARAGLNMVESRDSFNAARLVRAMRDQGVTAACFAGDQKACNAMRELKKAGVRIPEDLTVTGFDGTALDFGHDLTTLIMPIPAMVATVMRHHNRPGNRHAPLFRDVAGQGQHARAAREAEDVPQKEVGT